ncbi:unnamed protein product [Mesocestoides corti]|uniref:SCA7 domain-containing protein n=1 Tax=Mesocestoides corti TaxID=53468 RepID=A0A3P6I0I1_MESCO|nr:unnamed protein product [Mesocestoides corti]
MKSRTSGDSPSVCNSLDRDKLSSSSSCDRLSHSGVNSPDSPGTESSSSAPSKLIENPPDLPSIYPRKGLMEILQEESASLVSRTRRICGNPSKPVPSHPLCRSSISSLSVSHSQSYPSSPSSPSLGDRKESISISQSVHSIRKQVPVTTMQPASAELSQVRSNKQSPAEVQIHSRLRSQFETYLPHSSSFRHQHVVRQTPTSTVPIKGVETVSLISNDGPDTDVEMPHGFSAGDESVAAVYHLEQDSRTQFGRSQQIRSNRPSRNGSKASLPSYLRAAQNEKQWNASNFVAASGNWSKNSHLQVTQPNYYNALFDADSLRPHKSEQRPFNSDFGVYGKALRNPSEKSVNQQHGVIGRSANEDSERLHREILHSDTVINSLTQCGCVEMDDLRCKNSILCTVHTMEEKRRVPRPRDLKSLIREARQQQQHLLRLHESPIPTKVRRISSTAVSSKSTPPVPLLTSSSAPRTATPPVVTSAHRLAAFPASTTARRISVNGVITTVDGQPSATIQQPTILHRRVHHPSSLLRRNQQMWVGGVGQEKTSTSFISTTAASPGYYASPSPTALSKLAQEPAKLSDSREVQSRVVVNDDREKSITGRSRKSSRSGLRQPPSSLHNAYIQHITPSPTHTNSTALLLRASAANQIAAKLRGAAARDSATTAASWIGYGRGGTSDVQLAVSASSSTSSTASRHSNPSATAIAAKAANTHAFGSNRYILIGTKPLRKVSSIKWWLFNVG